MFRTILMRGASVGAMTLAVISSAQAQQDLPDIRIGAARNRPTAGRAVTRPVASTPATTSSQPAPIPSIVALQRAQQTEYGAEDTIVRQQEILIDKPRYASTMDVLQREPGVSMYTMGGVSGLPEIRGQADDRIKVLVGGVQTSSACANHMNNPLSYTDPNTIQSVDVAYAVSSVSKGGDSTAGSIIVEPKQPIFNSPATQTAAPATPEKGKGLAVEMTPQIGPDGQPMKPLGLLPWEGPGTLRFGANKEVLATGSVTSYYRGNNSNWGLSGVLNMATDKWAILYNGSFQRAGNYQAGGGAGEVYSTNFQSENHGVTVGYNNDAQLFTVRGTYQNIPYEGFPNMRMDLVRQKAYSLEARLQGAYDWGKLDARAYIAQVWHKMGFLDDRSTMNHPMINQGRDTGYSVKTEIPLTEKDTARIGNELHSQLLQDYWPSDYSGSYSTMGMGAMRKTTYSFARPQPFVVINNGYRNRVGTYAEWNRIWDQKWDTSLGGRNDTIWMNTSNVQTYQPWIPYNAGGMNATNAVNNLAAGQFNASGRARSNLNFDMAAVARYKPQDGVLFEGGYSRKMRSPSLYEMYIWPVAGPYMGMFNWYGDGNGYTGNLNLSPETSHNVSVTAKIADTSEEQRWEGRVTPFYTYVQNYIQGERTGGNFNFPNYPAGSPQTPNTYVFQVLKFANFNAQLYGADGFGKYKLYDDPEIGKTSISAMVSYVYGENLSVGNPTGCLPGSAVCNATAFTRKKGDGLWNIMPLNSLITLEHKIKGLTVAAETKLVDAKNHVSAVQGEFRTPAYALLNLRGAYEWSNFRIDGGVDNITNALYSLPLGGVDLTQYYRTSWLYNNAAAGTASIRQVPGMGRNFYAALTIKF